MATNPSSLHLSRGMTFGIELEFIVASPSGFFWPEDAVAAISRALMAAGVDSTGHERFDKDAEIFNQRPEFSQWVVQSEGGLCLSDAEEEQLHSIFFTTYAVEISSRKLSFAEDWQPELEAVLGVLRDLNQRGCKLITNATTGFHMHVGFGNEIVPLKTAKSVLQFCTAFEDRLDALYSTDRIDVDCQASDANGVHFNAGLSWHFLINKATSFSPNIFHWLASIEEASSYEKLGDFFKNECSFDNVLVTSGHFATVNIDNLYPVGHDNIKGTIEFRQHQGTLDLEQICTLIELKRTIVTWCHFVPDIDFLELLSRVSDGALTTSSLCRAIGATKELVAYYENRDSQAMEHRFTVQYNFAVAAVAEGKLDPLDALEAQSFVERYQRTNWTAVASKIRNKKMKRTYANLTTAPFDIAGNYNAFMQVNTPFCGNHLDLSTLARTMVFQQLNGSDSS